MPSKYTRKKGHRRDYLFVIAAEGASTEVSYFEGVQRELRNSRIKIEVLRRPEADSGRSTWPDAVEMLDNAKKKNDYRANDQFFVVVDRDHMSNKIPACTSAARSCKQKKYNLIVSNPCVELWFLLHYIDPSELTDEQLNQIMDNRHGFMKSLLQETLGEYNHAKIKIEHYFSRTGIAISRARELDAVPEEPWPSQLGTRLYLLLEELLKLDNH